MDYLITWDDFFFDVKKVEGEPFFFASPILEARELFATCVALPIAWLHLDADVESSRSRKHERVKEGAKRRS